MTKPTPTILYSLTVTSPWGPLFLAGTERGICYCQFIGGNDSADLIARLEKREKSAVHVQENNRVLVEARRALERYFSAEPQQPRHRLHVQGSSFQRQVWRTIQQIPPGRVTTYREIAARVGSPRAFRAVGQACRSNPVVLFIPCHRVVAASGKLGGFSGGLSQKAALLRHEGRRFIP
ncbi:MAG: methylated-DNA--[protein]-cysteine S-methyltransferase [Syntrophobacteria bacterium]